MCNKIFLKNAYHREVQIQCVLKVIVKNDFFLTALNKARSCRPRNCRNKFFVYIATYRFCNM